MSVSDHHKKIHLGAWVPPELYERFAELAKANERPVAAELRLAAKRHLATSGGAS